MASRNVYQFFRRPMRSNEPTNKQHFFRRPMRSNEPTNNQHFFHFFLDQINSQTKPQRPWSNCQLKLIQLTIRPNNRGKERFRETLVELSIETNFNFLKMNIKQVQKYSRPTDWTLVLVHLLLIILSQSSNQTKPQRPWSNWQLKLLQLTIRPNDRGKERFRETLVELSIETNFNFFKWMLSKYKSTHGRRIEP